MIAALIAVEDLETGFRSSRPIVPLIDEREARRLGRVFCDGWYLAINAVFPHLSYEAWSALHREFATPYEAVRDHLAYDNNVEYTLACRVALRLTRSRVRGIH